MGFVALIAFWIGIAKLGIIGEHRTAIGFVAAWGIGLFMIPKLGLHSSIEMVYLALLTIVVWLTAQWKSKM